MSRPSDMEELVRDEAYWDGYEDGKDDARWEAQDTLGASDLKGLDVMTQIVPRMHRVVHVWATSPDKQSQIREQWPALASALDALAGHESPPEPREE